MEISERQLEAAEQLESDMRDREVARIRSAMVLKGDEYCQDCGDPIDVARRMAMPSATRCIDCQQLLERSKRGVR